MNVSPSQFPPPVKRGEFIAPITSSADQQLDVGILFVGAGPASLAGALRLAQLLNDAPEVKQQLGDFPIAILEKGRYVGAHLLSGAIINPCAFRKLFPTLKDEAFPFAQKIDNEAVYFLTEKRALRIPTPPTMKNHGYYSASLSKVGKWLGAEAEKLGVTILPETVGAKLLVENGMVVGVRTGDKGRDNQGAPLPNFEPGVDIKAKVVCLGEGTGGHLTQAAIEHFELTGPNPQIYALGVKEVWEVKKPLNRVIHTLGWPLKLGKKYHEFGGSFLYPLDPNKVSIGLVVGLDARDATLSIHDLFQEMKLHPLFRPILEGGTRLQWGAKTIPEGGYDALPKCLHLPGGVILGDAAGLVNVPQLKGIDYAMWSGIHAAEKIFGALRKGADLKQASTLKTYDDEIRLGLTGQRLRRVRNMRSAFHHGFFFGAAVSMLATATRGLFPGWRMHTPSDKEQPLFDGGRSPLKPDGKLTFDKLSSVHAAGNRSRDKQPNHLRVEPRVPQEVGDAWIHMCPAKVYEWAKDTDGKNIIQVNPTNCVHCGAITAKGGRLTPPEGGSGPEYTEV